MNEERDRRRHERLPAIIRIVYESAGTLKTDYTENISRGGLFIATEDRFELGATVELHLHPPGGRPAIPVPGVVRWVGPRSAGEGQPPVPGIGVEFDLDDPVRRARIEALVDAALDAPSGGLAADALRILLVDPNRHARALFKAGLESMARETFEVDGYLQVFEAADGAAALDLLGKVSFGLAMVELRTPEIEGAELIRRIRMNVSASMPVFAMARPYPGDKAEALAAGADVFVRKPIVLKPLFNTLKMLLRFDPAAAA